MNPAGAEQVRLNQDESRAVNWKRWGPYLSERQWATVREDYSANGDCWASFPHDHSRSRAYRWGEDGMLGISDRECRLCFGLAFWNGKDPILKERLFGLTGPEGNHGEDVKELYYYLDSTPTHSYMKALYKYSQNAFPYNRLIEENRRRGLLQPEFELIDTGIFDENRYFDLFAEYAKAGSDDILIRIEVANRGPDPAVLHLLPTVWFRNTWSWGRTDDSTQARPSIQLDRSDRLEISHETLGEFELCFDAGPDGKSPNVLFTENQTNCRRLYGSPNCSPYVKDAFHEYLIQGNREAINPAGSGTKAAPHYLLTVPADSSQVLRLRLRAADRNEEPPFGREFDQVFQDRIREADEFYSTLIVAEASTEEHRVARQAYAGLLWTKQFYGYVVKEWLDGDPGQPPPPPERKQGRNHNWQHLYNHDIISMPDKWEYPWYAAWDLAFHMLPFGKLDPVFAKRQLTRFLREWYLHPNGQIPAYEFALSDVNPPVHAWATWRVYKISGKKGKRDVAFLESVFQKLLLNFTWWVNRKDLEGNNLFSGGFLGLDNIGVFDRSKPLPTGGHLQQADGTAWMAFYCLTMLSMSLELSLHNPVYEDMASKFFEHFVGIADAMNSLGGNGLWDEQDGFYYDQLKLDGVQTPLRTRSLVGLIPLIAIEALETDHLDKLQGFTRRMNWFLEHRPDLARHISWCNFCTHHCHRLLGVPSRERLVRVLRYLLDENEFLSPHGIRSVSKFHQDHPYVFHAGSQEYRVDYVPGEGNTYLFGGNSNWRGPVWFPINYLIVEALERYHHFYGNGLKVECPTGSGRMMNLNEVAREISRRLVSLFLPDSEGHRPCHAGDPRYAKDAHWKNLILFHEYFHGDTGRGLGASHQTGWTALAARLVTEGPEHRDAANLSVIEDHDRPARRSDPALAGVR